MIPPTPSWFVPLRLAVLLAAGAFANLHGQILWIGGGGNDNWTNGTNWQGGIAPANDGTAQIQFGSDSGNPHIDSDQSIASLTINSNSSYHSFTGSGTLTVGTGGLTNNSVFPSFFDLPLALAGNQTWTVGSGELLVGGLVSGTGSLTKAGSGLLELNGNNTFSGGLTLADGTTHAGADGALGTGGVTLASGNVSLLVNGTSYPSVANAITVAAGTGSATIGSLESNFATYTGDIALHRATTLRDNTGDRTTFNGILSGNVGTLTITGTEGGRVTLGGINAFVGDVSISDGVTLQLTSVGNQILPLATRISTNTSGRLWIVDHTTIGSLAGGADSVVQVAAGGVVASALSVGANNESTTFAGVMQNGTNGSDALSLTKLGTGTFTLSGANTYTGGTAVNAGTLLVNGSLAGTSVVVASGATLGGSGSLGGLATFASGAHLAPGNSPGTLTFAAGLTLQSGSILDFQLGTSSDLIAVTGGLLTGPGGTGGVTLNLFDSGGLAPATYTLFDYAGGAISDFEASDFTLGSTVAGFDYALALNTGSQRLELTVTSAIPEPSTYAALAGLGALGLALWHRRQRRLTFAATVFV